MTIFLETNEPGKPGTVARCQALVNLLRSETWQLPEYIECRQGFGTWEGVTSPNVIIKLGVTGSRLVACASFLGLAFSQDAVGLGDEHEVETGLIESIAYWHNLDEETAMTRPQVETMLRQFQTLYTIQLDQLTARA